jgi:glycopeptide antibiotics resistance protein
MSKRILSALGLIIYVFLLLKVLVLKDLPLIRIGHLMFDFGGTHEGKANWVPFKTILFYLMGSRGLLIGGINILGNIVLLIPFGFLLPLVYRSLTNIKAFIIFSAFCLMIEAIQAYLKIGIFDIDDVILNLLGCMIGYWTYKYLPAAWRYLKQNKFVMSIVLLVISTVLFLFIQFVIDLYNTPAPDPNLIQKMRAMDQQEDSTSTGKDLCNGTGGTGAILRVEKDHFKLKRRDGKEELIYVSGDTEIMTSSGKTTLSELKTGQRVTIVTGPDDHGKMVAAAVLVCTIN